MSHARADYTNDVKGLQGTTRVRYRQRKHVNNAQADAMRVLASPLTRGMRRKRPAKMSTSHRVDGAAPRARQRGDTSWARHFLVKQRAGHVRARREKSTTKVVTAANPRR